MFIYSYRSNMVKRLERIAKELKQDAIGFVILVGIVVTGFYLVVKYGFDNF